jgi:hypothetical protein
MRVRTAALAAGAVVVAILVLAAGDVQASPTSYSSCPSSDRTVPATRLPAADSELVPAGARGVLLCRYAGLNPPAKRSSLVASKQVGKAATVAELSRQLNALPRQVGVFSCPDDTGAMIVAYFHYRGASDDVVSVQTSGCELVSNGHVHRTAALAHGPQLLGELEAMTR